MKDASGLSSNFKPICKTEETQNHPEGWFGFLVPGIPIQNIGISVRPRWRSNLQQDISPVAMTSGNEKTSVKELFCFQCPEQDLSVPP
jgi:hypothetical protein